MNKKRSRTGESGNPAVRAHSAQVKAINRAYSLILRDKHYDDETLDLIHADHALYVALAKRGWVMTLDPESMLVPTDYCPSWLPSESVQDFANDIFYEPTAVVPGDNSIFIELAGPADGPFSGASYETLDLLLQDITNIEAYRYGNPFPHLPHAADTKVDSPTSMSFLPQ